MLRIDGLGALQARLKRGANVQDVKNAVTLNGAELQKSMMQKAAVDTGNMKRSIKLVKKDGGYGVEVGPTVNYAPYVEFGTRYMTAQPFIRPSYEQQKTKFIQDIARLVRD